MERAANQRYDAILMDMQMPTMDGTDAARRIRADDAGIPIIALTANAFIEDRERCFAAGMNDFITKPFDPDDLFTTLLKWIGPRPANGQTTTSKL